MLLKASSCEGFLSAGTREGKKGLTITAGILRASSFSNE